MHPAASSYPRQSRRYSPPQPGTFPPGSILNGLLIGCSCKMLKRYLLIWFLLLALVSSALPAATATVDPMSLRPTPAQVSATRAITGLMTSDHYKKTDLDDELSEAIFDRFLKNLDPNRSFLLAGDVEALSVYRDRLDDSLRDGQLEAPFAIFRVLRARMEERARYATSLLRRHFDFSRDEEYVFDRREAPWAKDRETLNELWRKRVKNDVLTLRLAGKTDEEIRQSLQKRYERLGLRADQVNADDVFQMFINAYTASVEPHTAYLSPRTSENFKIRMSLSLEGIGAVLQTDNDFTVVRRLIPGGPAAKSGRIHPEDRITGVGQGRDEAIVDVVSWRLEDVVELIRGPKGSVVRLEILPKGSSPSGLRKVVTLERNRIDLEEQAAKKSVIDVPHGKGVTHVGVIEVPTFYRDIGARARGDRDYRSTTRDVRRLLTELKKEHADGVVMDLRGDGGGSLEEAIELTGLFIRSGPIVQIRDSGGHIQVQEDPDPGIAYDGPLIVLVDRHSASASEIFAGAIQDYGRGIVVGEPTFGKGTVQSLMDLARRVDDGPEDLGQLKITIAQFFRISGGSTQHRGVVPDIQFETAVDSAEQGERALENALPWAKARPARFVAQARLSEDALAPVRARHRARIKANRAFALLTEKAEAQRRAREQVSATLLESRRRAESEALEKAEERRETAFREARGLEAVPKAEAPGGDEEDLAKAGGELWLEETAKILTDVIRLQSTDASTLQTAQQDQRRDTACSWLGC
jgi:carboxyl-terminal processing protease